MTLQEMKEILDAEVIVGQDQLCLDVKSAGCSDSMIDIPIFTKAGMVLLTGLTNPHVIDMARALGIAAIIIVRGRHVPPETIQLAEELQMPLLSTEFYLFESIGRLYTKGLVGCMQKVGEKPDLP